MSSEGQALLPDSVVKQIGKTWASELEGSRLASREHAMAWAGVNRRRPFSFGLGRF
ncbi:MAG: hypothetical protein ACI9HH_004461, partial [Pseudomonadota bacterium]